MSSEDASITIALPGVRLGFRIGDPGLRRAVKRRYRPFSVCGRSSPVIDVETTPPARDRQVRPFEPTVQADRKAFSFRRGDAEFRLPRRGGPGRLQVWGNPYSFDAALRVVYSGLLAEAPRGGFLLHAAAVKDRGKVFLFPGVSGAGKSTLARTLGFRGVLSDELVGVRPRRGGFSAFSTPFWGNGKPPRRSIDGPVSAIFFLQKAPRPAVLPVGAAEGQRRAMRCLLWFDGQDPALLERTWTEVIRLTRKVPCFRLAFDKREDPLSRIREVR